jgi:glycosyltransferase involved in cell wall biosynthesis
VLFVANRPRSNPFKDFATVRRAVVQLATARDRQRPVCLVALGCAEAGTETAGRVKVMYEPFRADPKLVARYYQAADVLAHAAHSDTFPITVLESLACGTPVVATGVGGIPEQVKDDVTGFLVPPGDHEAMAGRIDKLLGSDELLAEVGANASRDARARFDLARQVDDYIAWYEEVSEDWRQRSVGGLA